MICYRGNHCLPLAVPARSQSLSDNGISQNRVQVHAGSFCLALFALGLVPATEVSGTKALATTVPDEANRGPLTAAYDNSQRGLIAKESKDYKVAAELLRSAADEGLHVAQ